MSEFADWTRAYVMMGEDLEGAYRPVVVDELGQLYALVRGIDDDDVLRTLLVDDEGQLIIVPRGASGHYLTVDDDGFLTTVIKGKYLEELRTVTLDDKGRLSAFVIDSIDAWNRMLTIGNAELAARLGSVVAYDRRGMVAFIESFEHGRGLWTTSKDGLGAAVALDPTTSLTGGYSMKLTGGEDGDQVAMIHATRGQVPVGRMGLEFAFSLGSIVDYMEAWCILMDGTREYHAAVRYTYATGNLQVWSDGGDWAPVLLISSAGIGMTYYNTLKFVFDQSTEKYVRLMFNNHEQSISAFSLQDVGETDLRLVQLKFYVYSRFGENDVINVDDIIFTLAEPE